MQSLTWYGNAQNRSTFQQNTQKNHINDDSLANVCQQFSIHMNNTQYRNSAHVYKHNFLLSIMYVVRVQRKCTQGNDNWNKTKNCNCALAGRLAKFTRKKCAVFLFGSQTHYFCSPIKSEKNWTLFDAIVEHTQFLFSLLSHEHANFASFLLLIVNWVPFFTSFSVRFRLRWVLCVAEKRSAYVWVR